MLTRMGTRPSHPLHALRRGAAAAQPGEHQPLSSQLHPRAVPMAVQERAAHRRRTLASQACAARLTSASSTASSSKSKLHTSYPIQHCRKGPRTAGARWRPRRARPGRPRPPAPTAAASPSCIQAIPSSIAGRGRAPPAHVGVPGVRGQADLGLQHRQQERVGRRLALLHHDGLRVGGAVGRVLHRARAQQPLARAADEAAAIARAAQAAHRLRARASSWHLCTRNPVQWQQGSKGSGSAAHSGAQLDRAILTRRQ